MRNALRLALAYMRYYKKQTAALFVGDPALGGAADRGGSLFASGKEAGKGECPDRIRRLAL